MHKNFKKILTFGSLDEFFVGFENGRQIVLDVTCSNQDVIPLPVCIINTITFPLNISFSKQNYIVNDYINNEGGLVPVVTWAVILTSNISPQQPSSCNPFVFATTLSPEPPTTMTPTAKATTTTTNISSYLITTDDDNNKGSSNKNSKGYV